MIVSLMTIPAGFKIRKKTDCKRFMEKCMGKGYSYYIIRDDVAITFEKDHDGKVRVLKKCGDLWDVFNPQLEIASEINNCYKLTVADAIWKYRKEINEKWFNEK